MRITTISLFLLSSLFSFSQNTSNSTSNAVVTVNADPNLKELLKTKFSSKTNSNYKIQLYYGSLNKAHGVLNRFNDKYGQWQGKIQYETPNYKVWVGNYQTRIEADKALMEISKNFPHAFIFKPEK